MLGIDWLTKNSVVWEFDQSRIAIGGQYYRLYARSEDGLDCGRGFRIEEAGDFRTDFPLFGGPADHHRSARPSPETNNEDSTSEDVAVVSNRVVVVADVHQEDVRMYDIPENSNQVTSMAIEAQDIEVEESVSNETRPGAVVATPMTAKCVSGHTGTPRSSFSPLTNQNDDREENRRTQWRQHRKPSAKYADFIVCNNRRASTDVHTAVKLENRITARTSKTEDHSSKTEEKDRRTSKTEDSQGEEATKNEDQGKDHRRRWQQPTTLRNIHRTHVRFRSRTFYRTGS
jgi:hypothetical protein